MSQAVEKVWKRERNPANLATRPLTLVVVLLWLYLSAIAVLIGAEIDGVSAASPTRAT
jgi:hypothetical protein